MLMRRSLLCLLLLGTVCFGLATALEPWFQSWQGNRANSGSLLSIMMGDSRRLFANHFFTKADVYFHNGYYPSIFDNREAFQTAHMAEDSGVVQGNNQGDEDNFLAPPRDWIDKFGRHFYPSRHTHLDDHGASHAGHGDAEKGQEREILPWLKFSAELDPQRIETYTVSAYWLRERLHKVDEAEQFLRQGLRANPDSYEILYQLGVISRENRKDTVKARNLWELALRKWHKQESTKEDPDTFLFLQITSHLSLLEEEEGRWDKALAYMTLWKSRSPDPSLIQGRIDELRKKMEDKPASVPAGTLPP